MNHEQANPLLIGCSYEICAVAKFTLEGKKYGIASRKNPSGIDRYGINLTFRGRAMGLCTNDLADGSM